MIAIYDDFLDDDSDILDEMYQFFYYAGQYQFDFFPKDYILHNKSKSDIENKIEKLIKKICSIDLSFAAKEGYEVWVNVMDKANKGLDLHIDCNEYSEQYDPAKKTAVIYLGRDEDLIGGELVMDMTEIHDNYKFPETIYDAEKNMTNSWIKIPFKSHRLILFNSAYPHGVLPIKSIPRGNSRITMTISSWDKPIKVRRES